MPVVMIGCWRPGTLPWVRIRLASWPGEDESHARRRETDLPVMGAKSRSWSRGSKSNVRLR